MKNLLRTIAPLLLLAPPAAAQGAYASSESYVVHVPVERSGAENDAASPAFRARITVGHPAAAAEIQSAHYAASVGTAALATGLEPGPPRVFALSPGVGSKDGGAPFTLHGLHLQDGSSTANVLIGGKPTTSVAVATNTILTGVTGPGTDTYGNPLGSSLVRVTNGHGIGFGEDGYVYSPALVASAPPRVGAPYSLDLHLPPGSFHTVAFGTSIPGVAAPVWPLDGALEVLDGFELVTPFQDSPKSVATLVLPVPDKPALVGFLLELQAIVLTDLQPLAGTFTNRLGSVVQP